MCAVSLVLLWICCILCNCIKGDQKDGSFICSMDALFGLPRKKAAGCSHRGALHEDLFFFDQSAVDEYVASSKQAKHVTSVS